VTKEYVAVPIRRVSKMLYNGVVYNYRTSDETYLVNNILVHNCETTADSEIPQYLWYVWNPDVLIPVYFFTDRETYRIDKDYSKLGLTQDYVSKYKYWIDLMVRYVEVGVWLPVKWMHKTTRPAKPTEAIYIHTQ